MLRPVFISHWPTAHPSHSAKCSPTSLSAADSPDSRGLTNIRIRLVLNCAGLESETSRFRNATSDGTCKLCGSSPESALHFVSLPSVPPSHPCETPSLPAVSSFYYPNYSLTTSLVRSGLTTPRFKERLYIEAKVF